MQNIITGLQLTSISVTSTRIAISGTSKCFISILEL